MSETGFLEDDFQKDLQLAADGDLDARNRLWSKHYDTFRACAKAFVDNDWARRGDRYGVSIGGTHIVNVAYERLHDRSAALGKGRAWFFRCFYTECMRIVIDHYRMRKNDKQRRVSLNSHVLPDQGTSADPGVIYDILAALERLDPKSGQIAMLKIFESVRDPEQPGAYRGLRNNEVAEMLGYSLRLVEQRWQFAKAYLLDKLGPG